MPREFQYPSTSAIVQRRFQQPLSVPHIIALGPALYSVAGDSELRTTAHTNDFWHRQVWKQFLECLLVNVLCHGMRVIAVGFVLDGANFSRAANDPDASQVDVSVLLEIWKLEITKRWYGIVVWVVIMPGKARCVHEDDVVWKMVVVINDVCQVHHAFVPLILRDCQRCFPIIDDVDICLPLWEMGRQP